MSSNTPTTRPHLAAVLGLLVGMNVQVGGEGPLQTPGVVVWPQPGETAHDSLSEPEGLLEFRFTTVALGGTVDQAMWVSDKVAGSLNRVTVSVPGRDARPIVSTSSTPVQRDDDSVVPLFFCSQHWLLTTAPSG